MTFSYLRVIRALLLRRIDLGRAIFVWQRWIAAKACWKAGLAVREYDIKWDVFRWYFKQETFDCNYTDQQLSDMGNPYGQFRGYITVPIEVIKGKQWMGA